MVGFSVLEIFDQIGILGPVLVEVMKNVERSTPKRYHLHRNEILSMHMLIFMLQLRLCIAQTTTSLTIDLISPLIKSLNFKNAQVSKHPLFSGS